METDQDIINAQKRCAIHAISHIAEKALELLELIDKEFDRHEGSPSLIKDMDENELAVFSDKLESARFRTDEPDRIMVKLVTELDLY